MAERKDPKTKQPEILGVGRLSKEHGLNEGEFALLVNDHWQKKGLGAELLRRLVAIGKAEKLTRLKAEIMADNHAMQHVSKSVGFKLTADADNRDYLAEYIF